MARSRLQAVGIEDAPTLIGTEEPPLPAPAVHRPAQAAESALTNLLMMSLRALSQRAIVALASLVDFALIASVFVLFLLALRAPSGAQLVALAGYAVFVLVALLIRRKENAG